MIPGTPSDFTLFPDTHLFSTALMKSLNSGKGVPLAQIPSRTMYAMFLGSEAPVAEAYTTLALGNLVCNSSTVKPVFVGFPDPTGLKFLARWHSSNIICATEMWETLFQFHCDQSR